MDNDIVRFLIANGYECISLKESKDKKIFIKDNVYVHVEVRE